MANIVPSFKGADSTSKQSKKGQKTGQALGEKVTITTIQMVKLAEIVAKASVPVPENIMETTRYLL